MKAHGSYGCTVHMILLAVLLLACSSGEFTRDELDLLTRSRYEPMGALPMKFAQRTRHGAAGIYRTDVIRHKDSYYGHVWFFPDLPANYRPHIEYHHTGFHGSVDEVLAWIECEVERLEQLYIRDGVYECYHARARPPWNRMKHLTPLELMALHDSVRAARTGE